MNWAKLQQDVNRVFSLIYAWIGFIPAYFSSTAQDVTVTWENEDGTTTTQTHPNLVKITDDIKSYPIYNHGGGINIAKMLFLAGVTEDPTEGYVLCARKYNGVDRQARNGLQGTLMRTRGSEVSLLIAMSAEISITSAYTNAVLSAKVTSGHVHIRQVDYNGITYYAVAINYTSAHAVLFEGVIADPYNDGFPKVVSTAELTNIVSITTIS